MPKSLKTWFLIHFAVDYLFAIPLFLFPEQFLAYFNWSSYDPIATKLVAAALFAIGGISLLARNATKETYTVLLQLKLIWSFFVLAGLFLVYQQAGGMLWYLVFSVFLGFFCLWFFLYKRVQ